MIFISHSHKNEDDAKAIRNELRGSHYECFLSGDDLEPEDDWHDRIWKALSGCKAFLGVVTKEFFESAFCQQEVGAAMALGKPLLLILRDTTKPPGFAARFQACKRSKLLESLNTLPRYRAVRVAAWTQAVGTVESYKAANAVHASFVDEWDGMTDEEKLRWLVAAGGNGQVRDEGYKAGPFFKRAMKELKAMLTNEWLFDNDRNGHLHDWDANPIGKVELKKAKKKP